MSTTVITLLVIGAYVSLVVLAWLLVKGSAD